MGFYLLIIWRNKKISGNNLDVVDTAIAWTGWQYFFAENYM